MGLVHRNGNVYYYDTWREGDRVRSSYAGSGPMALLIHQEAEEKAAVRASLSRSIAEMRAFSSQIDEAVSSLLLLAEAELIASGFYKHKRQWRKRRHGESGKVG